jgi:hypothetical protein
MTYRAHYSEGRIAKLLGALPPAPPAWVEAAQELPAAYQAMDGMAARAGAAQEFQAEIVADLAKLEITEPGTEQAQRESNGNVATPGGTE